MRLSTFIALMIASVLLFIGGKLLLDGFNRTTRFASVRAAQFVFGSAFIALGLSFAALPLLTP